MNKIEMLKLVKSNDTYRVRILKNFYNMMILDYDYIPGEDTKEIFKQIILDIRNKKGDELLPKGFVYDLKSFYFQKMLEAVETENYSDISGNDIPNSIIEQVYVLFEGADKEVFDLNDKVIRRALVDLYSYHPLSILGLYSLRQAIQDATNVYRKIDKGGEKINDILFSLQEQISFGVALMKPRDEKELEIYTMMLDVDKTQTKDKLLEAFVKGQICRNDKLVDLFYNLFKDEYEVEVDVPLYHGVKPKSYDGEYDIERTFNDYSGYISLSRAKDVALKFATGEEAPGWLLKTVGPVRGLDIERMINEFEYSDNDNMLDNCRNEEEILVKYPIDVEIYDLKDKMIRNGLSIYNSSVVDLVNIENNAKCYRRTVRKMRENNLNVSANKMVIINRHFVKAAEDLEKINELIKESDDDVVYLIDEFIGGESGKLYKEGGYVNLESVIDYNILNKACLFDMIINENQLYLIYVPEYNELGNAV